MRISTIPGDPGWITREQRKRIVAITVNGVNIPLSSIIWADEEEERAMVLIRDRDGKPIEHPTLPGRYLTETRKGTVRIAKRVALHDS